MRRLLLVLVCLSMGLAAGTGAGCTRSRPPEATTPRQPTSAPRLDRALLERLVEQRVNEERTRLGRYALDQDTSLTRLARGHSADMARHGYFDHEDLRGHSPQRRARKARITCTVAENLFQTYHSKSYEMHYQNGKASLLFYWKTEQDIADEAVTGWLNSPLHRAALLNRQYTVQGIGAAFSDGFKIYVTQSLC